MPDRDRGFLRIDPDNYDPLFDIDFLDEDVIKDDQDLAELIGDERMRRRHPRVQDESEQSE